MKINKYLFLIFCVAVPLIAGAVGTIFTMPNISTWYAALAKPWFNPPNWVFGPVWTTLFVLMGIALYLAWSNEDFNLKDRRQAVIVFFTQLVLNVLWSYVFFGLHSPLGGAIVIVLLWTVILFTVSKFYNISKPAGLLLLPYILWVTFAGVLNFYIWYLNI